MDSRKAAYLLAAILLAIPVASGTPTIVEPSTAANFVAGNTGIGGDRFEFAGGNDNTVGTTITIIGPAGHTYTLTQVDAPTVGSARQHWALDGTVINNEGQDTWVAAGNLVGTPSDGTWRIDIVPVGPYSSDIRIVGGMVDDSQVRFTLGAKQIYFSASYTNSATLMQYWNWHISGAGVTWTEPSTTTPTHPITPDEVDPTCGGPDGTPDPDAECSTDYKFYQTTTGLTSPLGATGQTTPSCGTPSTYTATVAWKRGGSQTSNTYVRVVTVPGSQPPPIGDLRSNLLATYTALTNVGSGASGTHTTAAIPYNEASGHTYQVLTRSGISGTETFGNPVYIEPRLCVVASFDTTANTERDSDALRVTASQAQCNGDPTTLAIAMQDNPSGLTEHLSHLYVFDANQGGLNLPADPIEVAHFDSTTMHRTAAASEAHSHYIATLLPPGNYIVYAYADYTGIGAVDYIDSEAFSVPRGNCNDTATNLAPVLIALAEHDANQTAFHGNITAFLHHINQHLHDLDANLTATRADLLEAIQNLNVTIIGNVTGNFTLDNATLSNIYNILIEKLGAPGEPMILEIPALVLFLWLALLIIFLRLSKLLAAAASSVGLGFSLLFPGDAGWQVFAFLILAVALWLEAFARDAIYARFFRPSPHFPDRETE